MFHTRPAPRSKGNAVFAKFAVSAVGRGAVRRLATAALVSGFIATGAIVGAGVAVADDSTQHQGGAVATLNGLTTFDRAVLRVNGKGHSIPAGVFELTVDGGGRLKTYCIDIHNPTQDQAKYLETSWSETSLGGNKNAGKIRWILQHSYPQVDDLAELAKAAKTGPLTQKAAAAGTQVAIWRYSDNADVTAVDPAAEKLADWLHKKAKKLSEPQASLTLEPSAVSGKSGSRIGPVTVRTDADRVAIAPPADTAVSGVQITDLAGQPIASAVNGSKVYFDVPAGTPDGTAELSAQAATSIPVGRAFAASSKSQTQILAGSSESTVSATAVATWAQTGAIPAVSARKNCAEGGIDVTVSNRGDAPLTVDVAGTAHTVPVGASKTVTVPVAEDQPYQFAVTGPGGFSKTFAGLLDCKVTGAPDIETAAQAPGTQTGPPTAVGSVTTGPATGGLSTALEGDLAATGGSDYTPVIAGTAVILVVIGGGAVFFLRKKKTPEPGGGRNDQAARPGTDA
ncbi:Cys-Gln thioester bond-forming surface protein [Streptomyces sp. NBC_00690]|uniref:Cys-Gln thioester bond-forming surface protein n=1 Tax=Streptomyces sp. NBC_00690 TaxID=2975808 RepID=UPI003FA7E7AA